MGATSACSSSAVRGTPCPEYPASWAAVCNGVVPITRSKHNVVDKSCFARVVIIFFLRAGKGVVTKVDLLPSRTCTSRPGAGLGEDGCPRSEVHYKPGFLPTVIFYNGIKRQWTARSPCKFSNAQSL